MAKNPFGNKHKAIHNLTNVVVAIFLLLNISGWSLYAESTTSDSSVVRYDQAYFAKFQPVTLEDMIKNIPGGAELLKSTSGYNGRGFSANGSQILINGKRISGKSNNMRKSLSLILASQVDHIQLIRGTAEGLDVRSKGMMLNAILKSDQQLQSSSLMKASINSVFNEEPFPGLLLLSHNKRSAQLRYGLSYQYQNHLEVMDVPDDIFNISGTREEYRQGRNKARNKSHLITGNMGFQFQNNDIININVLYSDEKENEDKYEEQFLVSTDNNMTLYEIEDKKERDKEKKWEIGADYESSLGSAGMLKALFIINRETNHNRDMDYLIIDKNRLLDYTYFTDAIKEERIFRTSMTKKIGSAHTLEYGLEGVFNQLDKTISIDSEPAENTLVSEDRYELFVTDSWTISNTLSAQLSLTKELSEIRQLSTEIDNLRSFSYLKPRLEFRYNYTDRDQIRLLADRTVSQLNLGNFIVSRNEEDETLDIGNPDLVPEIIWTYSVSYEHQLAENAGSLEAKLFYKDITDHIDKIDMGDLSSGVGNIGDARRYGLELNSNVRLGFMGLPDALAEMTYILRESEAIDPFTGEKRPMKNTSTHHWNLDFRHDVTEKGISYGFNVHKRSPMYRTDISLYEIRTFKYHFRFFIDYMISPTLKIQGKYNHPLRDRKLFNKTYYEGLITAGQVDLIESYVNRAEPDVVISIQKVF